MKDRKFRGIVVRTVDYLESDRLLTVLTFEDGMVTIKAKGVRKQKARLSYAASQFFCGDFECVSSRGRYILTGAETLYDFSGLAEDLDKYYHACHFMDIASSVVMEDHPDEEMLRFLLNSLHMLAKGQGSLVLLTAIFEFRTAVITGFSPSISECAVCSKKTNSNVFSGSEGGFVCCARGTDTDEYVRKALGEIVSADVRELFTIKMPEESAVMLKKLSGEYIENVFDRRFRKLEQLNDF